MEADRLRMFVEEVEFQSGLALRAYAELQTALSNLAMAHPRDLISADVQSSLYTHAVLSHAANVSKLFWPASQDPDLIARGEQLRTELGVKVGALIGHRKARNYIEHFDEYLQDWNPPRPDENPLDRVVMPILQHFGGFDTSNWFRIIDPERMAFLYRYYPDKTARKAKQDKVAAISLKGLANELQDLEVGARGWLKAH